MGEPHITCVDVHICPRGDGEGERRVGTVSEDGELEGDVLLQLHADGIGFLHHGY